MGGQSLRIGIDLDEVVYPFVLTWREYAGKEIKPATRWAFYEDDGMTAEEFLETYRKGVDEGFILAKGIARPGAVAAMEALRADGHTLHIITDRFVGEHARRNTVQWLAMRDIPFDSLTFSADKTVVETDAFIDDKPANVDALRAAGCHAFLLDTGRNDQEGHPWLIASFEEFVERVDELVAACREAAPIARRLIDELRVTDPNTGGQKGKKLPQLGALDPLALLEVAKVAGFGAEKYERYNYLRGFDWSLSFDALQRHSLEFWGGIDHDDESGLPHIAHAAWQALCLLSFMLRGVGTDNRPPLNERKDT